MTIPSLQGLYSIIHQSIRILTDLTIEVWRGIGRMSTDDSISLITQLTPLRGERQGTIPVLRPHILNQSINSTSHDTQCITHRVMDAKI